MCGIIGAISNENIVGTLVEGLKRLEYRGYDSAGIAVNYQGTLRRLRRIGRVSELESAVEQDQLTGQLGIGHTRWATHGGVTEPNAHPHVSGELIAVVHNGIIENHDEERHKLQTMGYMFESQTDTEVIAHLIHYYYKQLKDLYSAVKSATQQLKGAYAIAVIAADQPEKLVCARQGCPLLIGVGEHANFVASDVSAILSVTRKIVFLEEGDTVELTRTSYMIENKAGEKVHRKIHLSDVSLASLELGEFKHYMQKEIYEQPRAITDTLDQVMVEGLGPELFGKDAAACFANITSIKILACGTSYYAGMVARYWLEGIAGMTTSVEIASEYRYRTVAPNPGQLVVTLSQSGETLDTLEALKYAKTLGYNNTLSICNVRESAIPRASRMVFYIRAGAEIGVASTKAFTTQLVALFLLCLTLAKQRGLLSPEKEAEYMEALRYLPGSVQHALNLEPQIRGWAERFADKQHALFLGRGVHYPIALEGALKLKETSYIHAEAYPAGELKHGPLALVDQKMPVVVIAPNDALLEKVKSNMQEVRARGGELFVFADLDSHFVAQEGVHVIRTPRHVGVLSPVVHTIPVQLLAYNTALMRGTDVDKPRNLAKSVTVE